MAELSEALLSVLPSIRVPKAGDRVHKDECAFSFDTPVSSPRGRPPRPAGLLPAPTRSQPTRAPGVPPARGAMGFVVPRLPGRVRPGAAQGRPRLQPPTCLAAHPSRPRSAGGCSTRPERAWAARRPLARRGVCRGL